jgi:hypothetical protein
VTSRFMTHPGRRELEEVVVNLRQGLRWTHFFLSRFFASGYLARSACHFFTSSGRLVVEHRWFMKSS